MAVELESLVVALAADSSDFKTGLQDADNTAKSWASGLGDTVGGLLKTGMMAGVGAIVAGVGAIGAAAFSVASEVHAAAGDMAASLGLPIEEAEKFADVAKEVYGNNFADSVDDAAKAVANVAKQLKLTAKDPALKTLTENAFRLRDAFDVDVNESVSAAQTLMENFGISGEEAFKLIAYGHQQGLDRSGDFLDTIGEYSTQFKEGGASAYEFFGFLESGLQGGMLGTDKAADAFKEFRVRIQDGSTLTRDSLLAIGLDADTMAQQMATGSLDAATAFGMVRNALSEIDDENIKMQAGVGLLGTQFEDLGSQIVEGLKMTEPDFEKMDASLTTLDTQYNTLGDVAAGMWRKFQVGIEPAGKAILDMVNDNLPLITQLVESASAGVVKFVNLIPGAIADVKKKWDENWAGMRTTYTEWEATTTQQNAVFWMEWNRTFNTEADETTFTWETMFRNLSQHAAEQSNAMNEQLINGMKYLRMQRQFWGSLIVGDWESMFDAMGDLADHALDWILERTGDWGVSAREVIVGALNNMWEGMKQVWEDIDKWWSGNLGKLLDTFGLLPESRSQWGWDEPPPPPVIDPSKGTVNPWNQRNWNSREGDSMDWLNENWREYEAPMQPQSSINSGNSYAISVSLNGSATEQDGRAVGAGILQEFRARGLA